MATPNSIQEDFKKYVNYLKWIKCQLHWIKHWNIRSHTTSKLVGVPEVKQRESARDTLQLCMRIYNNNKLYLNTVATELMCFYKFSKNVYIYIYMSGLMKTVLITTTTAWDFSKIIHRLFHSMTDRHCANT